MDQVRKGVVVLRLRKGGVPYRQGGCYAGGLVVADKGVEGGDEEEGVFAPGGPV